MEIRALNFPFTKNGWTHELIQREGLVCLVRRHKRGRLEHFELIVASERPEEVYQRAGREIKAPYREAYPRSEDWGMYGFTYSVGQCGSLDKASQQAKSKFAALT